MCKHIETVRSLASERRQTAALVHSGEVLSYADLWLKVIQYRDLLDFFNVSRLAVYLDNSPDWVAIDLAASLLGIPVAPVPKFFSEAQKNHILGDAGIDTLLAPFDVDDSWLMRLGKPNYVHTKTIDADISIYTFGVDRDTRPEIPFETAKISYTSGSTGTPKGVCLSALLLEESSLALSEIVEPLKIAKHLSILPYSTLLENLAGLHLPLSLGSTVHCEPSAKLGMRPSLQLDAQIFAQTYASVCPNSLILTPQLLQMMCDLVAAEMIDISALRFVAVGGASCSPLLLKRVHDLQIPVFQGYGLSECGSVVSLNSPSASKLGSSGKPLSHLEVGVNDDGEVVVSGSQLGYYLNQDQNDAAKFPSNILSGDLGHIDADGHLTIEGRKKNILVLSTGRNLSPEWVESELMQQSEIAQCLVYGDGDKSASALIVAANKEVSDHALLNAVLLANLRLPAYAQIEQWRRAHAFTLANKQLTTNGKFVRQEILAANHRSKFSRDRANSPSSKEQADQQHSYNSGLSV